MVSGGMAEAATPGARLIACFSHPAHPLRWKTWRVAFSLNKEHETMTINVIHLTRRTTTATPTTALHDLATTTAQNVATMAAYQEAENALAMALHYMRSSASNVPGATRKAVQALGALNRLNTPVHTSAHAGAVCHPQIGGAA
jgi:hypothetical protein